MESEKIVMFSFAILFYIVSSFFRSTLSSINTELLYTWKNNGFDGLSILEEFYHDSRILNTSFTLINTILYAVILLTLNSIYAAIIIDSLNNILITLMFSLMIIVIIETITQYMSQKIGIPIIIKLHWLIKRASILYIPINFYTNKIIMRDNNDFNVVTHNNDAITMHLDDKGELLEEHEVRMIKGVFELDKKIVREIMIPRVDMATAEIGTPISEIANEMLKTGHSKMPVYYDELDKIKGIVHSMDILKSISNTSYKQSNLLNDNLRPVLFIPESKTLEDLLTEFQEKRMQMAIVIDEYGGVSGLVTVEDVVEEIVGELHDEFDIGEPTMVELSKSDYKIDAGISIDELTEKLGINFEGEGFDTIGGFVLHQLGKIPSEGDYFYYNRAKIEVLSTLGRRLKQIRINTNYTA